MSPRKPLFPQQLSASKILKPATDHDLTYHQLVAKSCFHLNHTSVLAPSQFICISLPVSDHNTFPSVFHLLSHSLVPASTAPSLSISIYPGSCVIYFVYLPEDWPCHETLGSKKKKKKLSCESCHFFLQALSWAERIIAPLGRRP